MKGLGLVEGRGLLSEPNNLKPHGRNPSDSEGNGSKLRQDTVDVVHGQQHLVCLRGDSGGRGVFLGGGGGGVGASGVAVSGSQILRPRNPKT